MHKPKVLITVSHYCFDASDIDCDKNSLKFGKYISSRIHNSELFVTRTQRYICDTNRVRCRNNEMRINLTKRMEELYKEGIPFFLLDIHSFVDGTDFELDYDPEIVIIDFGPSTFTDYISEYNVQELESNNDNDILIESKNYTQNSVLIEIRKDIKNLDYLVNSIKSWINHTQLKVF